MFQWLGKLVDSNEKELKRLQPLVDEINSIEPEFVRLSDDELRAKTAGFKDYLSRAASEAREQLTEMRRELDESRQKTNQTQDKAERDELESQVKRFEERIKELEKEEMDTENEALDQLLPEAFAAVREAAKRTIHQRHFDVQLMGGIVLHQGKIAEMKTGEGKTLVATLPLYLNSLTGRGCHLVTVNDYLARRDPYWMGPIFHALGISVASIYPQQSPEDYTPSRLFDPNVDSGDRRWPHFRPVTRQEAYQADITYGTSSDFGFDYLRDNMVVDLSQCVQRMPLNYAIVDEVDNLLIDEARTPLIISGPAREAGDIYKAVDNVVGRLNGKVLAHEPVQAEEKEQVAALEPQYDYIAFERERHVIETPHGQEKVARAFGMKSEDLFGGEAEEHRPLSIEEVQRRNEIRHILRQSLLAYALYQKDRDYVVDTDTDGQMGIIIIDEFTGRRMLGRRYSEGLHQAIEAKERLRVRRENLTLATVTIQNYFRMYRKLAGMTGTALTEAEEFHKIYKLEVVLIPTNKAMIRQDSPDRIYKDEAAKFKAVVNEVEEMSKQKRPVLIGTVSIEKSERLSEMMKRRGIVHQVLNAKQHEREAYIVAEAGKPGAVTVATNMAGRGVDIILGGKSPEEPEKPDTPDEEALKEWQKRLAGFPKELSDWGKRHREVIERGGLHILGTERHESRRVDNQLRGRAGRQGDPGSSRFYVSLEDDIIKRFGGDRIKGIMNWVGMDENTPIENKLINRSIEGAQVRVEGYHFDIRKNLVEFDDVVNQQRELIYAQRRKILSGADLKANILSMVEEEVSGIVGNHAGDETGREQDISGLLSDISDIMPLTSEFNAETLSPLDPRQIEEKLIERARALYEQREKEIGAEMMRILERMVMLRTIDSLWVEHLTTMEQMRLGAGWQVLRQVKSVDAYKNMGYQQFQVLRDTIRHDVAHTIFHVSLVRQETKPVPPARLASPMAQVPRSNTPSGRQRQPVKVAGKKVGRNDPCPCGSGKKYKHCHGK